MANPNQTVTAGYYEVIDQPPADLNHTIATNDDGEFVAWHVETRKLPTDFHFFTLDVSGVSGSNYADMFILADEYPVKPVTQTTAILPAASQYVYAG